MPNPSRDKGSRFERELVDAFRSAGLDAYRIPLSGAATGFKSDVQVRLPGGTKTIECKSRHNGFRQVYEYLEGSDYLAIKQDRHETLMVMRLEAFIEFIRAYNDITETRGASKLPTPNNRESNSYNATEANITKPITMISVGRPSVRTTEIVEEGCESPIHLC